jgi:hypothetical protein
MRHIAIAILLAAGSCGTVTPTPTPSADCSTACARGRALGCPWSEPTAVGATCEAVCTASQPVVPWSVECITAAPTCAVAEACQ